MRRVVSIGGGQGAQVETFAHLGSWVFCLGIVKVRKVAGFVCVGCAVLLDVVVRAGWCEGNWCGRDDREGNGSGRGCKVCGPESRQRTEMERTNWRLAGDWPAIGGDGRPTGGGAV